MKEATNTHTRIQINIYIILYINNTMMGYKSGNSFEMMANNKYSQTKTHNQHCACGQLSIPTPPAEKIRSMKKESNHLGKESNHLGQKERALNARKHRERKQHFLQYRNKFKALPKISRYF